MDIYEWADGLINSCPRYETGFTQLLAAKPYRVSPAVRNLYDSRLGLIRSFQQTALDYSGPPSITSWTRPSCTG